jgi:hypothetical protein
MAQDYTPDCFAPGNTGQDDLQNMEDNFAALFSCHSGASEPSETAAGQLWLDTGNHILKIRNEADSEWLSIFDLANGRVLVAYQALDHGTATTAELVNVCYGTGSPPAANTTTEGSLFIKYST